MATSLAISATAIQREFIIESGAFRTSRINGRGSNTVIIGEGANEFEISIKTTTGLSWLKTSDFIVQSCEHSNPSTIEIVLTSKPPIELLIKIHFESSNSTSTIHKRVEITNTGKEAITVLDLGVESLTFTSTCEHGGLGQPLFTPGFFWCMEWPAGTTWYDGNKLRSFQYPAIDLEPGRTFISDRCTTGTTEPGFEKAGFLSYWETRVRKKRGTILAMYCDWAAHDELSGQVPMTLEKARKFLEIIARWKDKGLDLQRYVLDTFWFEPSRKDPYSRFNKWIWPKGPGEFLAKIQIAGIRIGLWIDLAGYNNFGKRYPGIIDDTLEQVYRLPGKMKILAGSKVMRAAARWLLTRFGHKDEPFPCLLRGSYASQIEKALLLHVKEFNLNLIKVDFANFRCNNPHHGHEQGRYAYDGSIRRFRRIVARLREVNPALVVIAYNGFTTHQGFVEQPTPPEIANESAISPFWLSWLDTICIGDPRLSDMPSPTERSSIACYADTQYRLFKENLLPVQCIDDHSVLIGNTPANLNLGSKDWTDAWMLGNIGRGHGNFFVYGDMRLIDTEDDFNFLLTTWQFLHDNIDACNDATFLGGRPDKCDVYGYFLPGTDGIDYYVLHNPSFTSRQFKLPASPEKMLYRLYPSTAVEECTLVMLAPTEVALFQANGDQPHYSFNIHRRFEAGQELLVLNEQISRSSDVRIIEGDIVVPANARNQELHVVISLSQSIYPWRKILNPRKEFKFTATKAGKKIPYDIMPTSQVRSLTSWCVFRVIPDVCSIEEIVHFKLQYPWDRLVHAHVNAFWLERGQRE